MESIVNVNVTHHLGGLDLPHLTVYIQLSRAEHARPLSKPLSAPEHLFTSTVQ